LNLQCLSAALDYPALPAGDKISFGIGSKSVQRHLGSTLYVERVARYKSEMGLAEDNYDFSEKDLVKYFRGESREMKRYILNSLRDWVTHNPDNKLKEYVEFSGKGKDRPLSYSTLEKTFYSLFIFQDVLETPIGLNLEMRSSGNFVALEGRFEG
jgi:hypothetical protein